MKFSVDDYHIRCGRRKSMSFCPVALAVGPRIPAGWDCQVVPTGRDATTLYLYKPGGEQLALLLPPEEHARIQAYDEFGAMEPHEFEIDLRF